MGDETHLVFKTQPRWKILRGWKDTLFRFDFSISTSSRVFPTHSCGHPLRSSWKLSRIVLERASLHEISHEFSWNMTRESPFMYHQDISPRRWRNLWGELKTSLLQITKRERNLRQLHSNGEISEHATSATTRKGICWECSRCKFHRGLHRIVISSPSSSPSDVINHETILESIPALELPILHTGRG